MEHAGLRWNDQVPRNHRKIFVIKDQDSHDMHSIYWHESIRGVAIMDPATMEFYMAGFTCKDKFYGYEGEEYNKEDIVVVGNTRFDETPFCKKRLERYKYHMKYIKGEIR